MQFFMYRASCTDMESSPRFKLKNPGSEECVMPLFVSEVGEGCIYLFICICLKYLRKDAASLSR